MAKKTSKKGSGKVGATKPKAAKAKRPAAKKPVAKKKLATKKKVAAPKPAAKPAPKSVARPSLRRPVKDRPSVTRMPSPRPAPHKAQPLAGGIFERDLEKNAANYAPLTPLQFLERSASVYPERLALVHGPRRQTWAATYERCRRLASALDKIGIGVGDTVAIMAPNIPEMYEAHFGVPMTGAVLNCLNTRLDAAMIAFILDHSEVKVLIVDREYHRVATEALAIAGVQPLVVDIDDPQFKEGVPIGDTTYEEFIATGEPDYAWEYPTDEWNAISLQLHIGHDRQSEGRRVPSPRRDAGVLRQRHTMADRPASDLSLDTADVPLQRLVLPTDAGAGRRHVGVPPAHRRQIDLRRTGRSRRDAHVRRADHHAVHHRRHARRAPHAAAQDRVP